GDLYQGGGESRFVPGPGLGLPDARLADLVGADDHVEEAVAVDVEQAHPVVLAVGGPQGHAGQQVFVQPLLYFAEGEALDLLAVRLDGVIDQLDDLGGGAPGVGVEDEVEAALLADGGAQASLPVAQQARAGVAVQGLPLPVAGRGTGELPAQPADDVRVGVILDEVDERLAAGVILAEALPAVLEHQVAGQFGVVGGEQVEDGGVEGEEVPLGRALVENLGVEARAGGVHGVAAGNAEGDRPAPRHGGQQVDAAVVGGPGLCQVAAPQQRAGVVNGVRLQAEPF